MQRNGLSTQSALIIKPGSYAAPAWKKRAIMRHASLAQPIAAIRSRTPAASDGRSGRGQPRVSGSAVHCPRQADHLRKAGRNGVGVVVKEKRSMTGNQDNQQVCFPLPFFFCILTPPPLIYPGTLGPPQAPRTTSKVQNPHKQTPA
jgi:hypothetical protein